MCLDSGFLWFVIAPPVNCENPNHDGFSMFLLFPLCQPRIFMVGCLTSRCSHQLRLGTAMSQGVDLGLISLKLEYTKPAAFSFYAEVRFYIPSTYTHLYPLVIIC